MLIGVVLVSYALGPLTWMAVTSLKAPGEPMDKLLPTLNRHMFDTYIKVLRETSMPVNFLNSLVVALSTAILVTMLSAVAGYAFARLRFPGKRLIALGILMTQTLPGVLLLMPLFVLVWRLGLLNTLFSLVLVTTAFALPFSLWTMRGYMLSVPEELEEAAQIDGCTRMEALFYVVLPLVGPGAAAVAIFSFTVAWQEYVFALSFISDEQLYTVPLGLNAYISEHGPNWNQLCAAGVVATAPIVIMFGLLQRYFVAGITAGAVKE